MSRIPVLIVNPMASGGRARRALDEAVDELTGAGAEHRTVTATDVEHACEAALGAAAAGETPVAVGGDGIVGPLAGALRGSSAALGIVPAGRGNDFARVVGIPRDPRAAARLVLDGGERPIDVAEANGTPFVGIASLGFDSDANRIANNARLVRGNLVYLYAALRALAGWKHARFEIAIDDRSLSLSGYSVAIANSQAYGGGMFVAPQARLDDGVLDLVTVGARGKLAFLRGLPKVFRGAHLGEPGVGVDRGRRIEVRADRDFTVYADGDPIAELPLTVTVSQGALRLIAPPEPRPA